MRRFIYLDTDTLNSYLAQIYGGLVEKTETEKQSSKTNKKESSNSFGAVGQIAAKLFGKGVEGKLDYTFKKLKGSNNTELIKDVQTKIIHDNAFEELIQYLNRKELLNDNPINVGDFVIAKNLFFVLDLEYYQNLFMPGAFLEFIKQSQAENIRLEMEQKINEDLNRKQQRDNEKQIEKMIKDEINNNNDSIDDIHNVIKMINAIVPYRRMLCMKNYLIVLNDSFCRDNIEMLSFKYGGEIKILGYITNKILGEENDEGLSVFAGLSTSINAIMQFFFDNKEEL